MIVGESGAALRSFAGLLYGEWASWKSRTTCDSRQHGGRCRHRAPGSAGGRESEMPAHAARAACVDRASASHSPPRCSSFGAHPTCREGDADAPRPAPARANTTPAPGDHRARASCRAPDCPIFHLRSPPESQDSSIHQAEARFRDTGKADDLLDLLKLEPRAHGVFQAERWRRDDADLLWFGRIYSEETPQVYDNPFIRKHVLRMLSKGA